MEVLGRLRGFSLPVTAEAGILVMVATTATFAASDATVKVIGAAVPLLALLLVRYFFQAVVLGVWQTQRGAVHFLNTGALKLQVLRAFLLLSNSACTFAGLRYLPLPVTTALAMMAPLITTLLAATVLNEDVPRSKWAMVVLGFIGMLMVVRPGSGQFSWTVIFPIGAATTFACFQVASSKLSKSGDPITTNFLTALVATVALALLLWADQATMLPEMGRVRFGSWLLVLLMASLATFGHVLMLQALRRAPLALLTPFGYAQLAFATLFSWVLFSQIPDLWTGLGMIVIALGGIGTVLLHSRARAA
ncbi:DMT family transporter [Paraburkholderia saeva]|jgi:drug/metabolite transporter (DMT)-like permease|uniref:Riboflavin transporter n=1 Tax=Paraburkholderia saeva TaxID=2777537 RepID=A0A9N8X4G9_9BURK|nr:DMT family transporter [Paraburkholderia saeva]CAG4890236.1 Riboflavin transporter [Paraburkholderia saeva]CAG4911669.1 Riboflavin transporter [Paraburkholderia saeva]